MSKISKTEKILELELNKMGLKPRRQFKISDVKADLVFPEYNLIIELDGEGFHDEGKDKKRDYITKKLGWETKRFDSDFTFKNPNYVAKIIKEELIKRGLKQDNQSILFKNKKDLSKKEQPLEQEIENAKSYTDTLKLMNEQIAKEKASEKKIGHQRPIASRPPEKNNFSIRNILIFLVAVILVIILLLYSLNYKSDIIQSANPPPSVISPPTSAPPSIVTAPEVKPLIVNGSKTEVIITNNQAKDISLNITYSIVSNFFGINSQQSQIFNVPANTKKSFLVYDNVGCDTAPCGVGIINYTEIN